MKKYFFCVFILFFMFITVSTKTELLDKPQNLNSKNLLSYLKWEEKRNPYKICNVDYCDYLKSKQLDKAILIYIDDYINFIKENKDEETSLRVGLQGFKITQIYYRY